MKKLSKLKAMLITVTLWVLFSAFVHCGVILTIEIGENREIDFNK